ncbi:MAG: hypothetical protein M9890_13920 [Thermomicrobiales bacterium]|nr:hypothetical protein [Thermomicrobiales bacterium]
MRHRLGAMDFIFLALMMLGIAAAVYHAWHGRYANALMASGAAILGTVVLLTDQSTRTPQSPFRLPRWRPWRASDDDARRGPSGRWLSNSILAGFAATTIMSFALIIAYIVVGFIGSENGNTLSHWFWSLKNNDLTDGIYDIPIAAFSINLIAGLIWALIYARFVEPTLRGAGWWRGMVFSIGPWLLSLIAFFPLVGAGFLGLSLDAGPLPAIGNLVLHLLYGAALGGIYALSDLSAVDEGLNAHEAQVENDGIAFGLVAGFASGIVIGAIVSAIMSDNLDTAFNVMLVGAAFGSFIGGMAGPFLSMGRDMHHDAQ